MTISKELAQRLVDAGIVVEAEKWLHDGKVILNSDHVLRSEIQNGICIPLSNSDELLSVLPARIIYNGQVLQLEMYKEQNGYGYRYCKEGGDSVILSIHKSSSEALGLLALKLAEAGLLNKENV